MPQWQTANIQDIDYLSGGYSNTNYALTYQGARYVLRIPERDQPYVDRTHEAAWYAKLPDQIGVKPIALDDVTGLMLTPWVDGTLLAEAHAAFGLDDLANYLKRLHGQLPRDSRVYSVSEVNSAFWQHRPTPYSVEQPQPSVMTACHNDLNPWNILVTDTGWVTLDWEFAGLNDPLFDLVALHQGLELPTGELYELACLYAGAHMQDLETRLQQALHAFWVRELGWAQFQLSAGNQREEIVQQKATALRILNTL